MPAAPVGGHACTVEVDVEIEPGYEAGLLVFYRPEHATGITLGPQGIGARMGERVHIGAPTRRSKTGNASHCEWSAGD